MNLPNKLTVLRVLMVPFFVFFALADFIPHHNLITNFGKLMDPLADKIMVMAALICFVAEGFTNVWFVLLIMVREFAVTSIRMIAVENGKVIPANNWGKAKTVSQIVAICVVFASQYVLELHDLCIISLPYMMVSDILGAFSFVCMAAATALAVISGVIYAKDSAGLFTDM
ncbi:MAG: CDP-diacylglycerol--glycerol-3-phosphate 3-phosphatidyltransferase [Clostridia bacterium]|nr:CDP-diacylglycerol--glycerol-3-phosphate 3-phosphatidyltransferase [Clostridia bacterium]